MQYTFTIAVRAELARRLAVVLGERVFVPIAKAEATTALVLDDRGRVLATVAEAGGMVLVATRDRSAGWEIPFDRKAWPEAVARLVAELTA